MFEKPTLIIEFCGIAISLIFVVFLVATWLIRKKDISNLYLAIYFILNFIYQSIRVYQLISPNFENSILINRTEVALTYTILLFCSLFIIEYCKSKVHKYFTIILLTFVMLSVFICFFTDLFIASTIESHTFFNEKFYGVIPGKLSGIFNIVFLSYYGFLIGIIIKYKSQIKFEKTIISIGYGAIIFSLLLIDNGLI